MTCGLPKMRGREQLDNLTPEEAGGVSNTAVRESGDGSEGPVEQPPEFGEATVADKSHSESPANLKTDDSKQVNTEAAEPSVEEQTRIEADDEGDDESDTEEFKDVFEVPPMQLLSRKKHSVSSTDGDRRKRSLTATEINLEVLEARDTLGELYSNVSKDDNFDTEFGKRHHFRAPRLAANTAGA